MLLSTERIKEVQVLNPVELQWIVWCGDEGDPFYLTDSSQNNNRPYRLSLYGHVSEYLINSFCVPQNNNIYNNTGLKCMMVKK